MSEVINDNAQNEELLHQQEVEAAMRSLETDEYDESYAPLEGAPVSSSEGAGDGTQKDVELDENGNPIVPEPELDENGNPIVKEDAVEGEAAEPAEEVAEESKDEGKSLEELMNYEGDYTNGIARALDNIGNVFPEDSALNKFFKQLADKVEERFGSFTSSAEMTEDMREELTTEIVTRDGGEAFSESKDAVVAATSTANAEDFVAELHETAQSMESGESTVTVADNNVAAMTTVIEKNAELNPGDTAEAVQLFNDAAQAQIDAAYEPGSAEHTAAMDSLATVTAGMTEPVYEGALEAEKRGELAAGDKETLNALADNEGVEVAYEAYTPGADITAPNTGDAADVAAHDAIVAEAQEQMGMVQSADDISVLKKSDGHMFENLSEGQQNGIHMMQSMGRTDVIDDTMRRAASWKEGSMDFERIDTDMRLHIGQLRREIHENRQANGEEGIYLSNQQAAANYMDMMRGIQAYNDAAVDQIREKYQDDPLGQQKATEGLGKVMRTMVGNSFDALQNDDDALGFLSEEDIAELDAMQFTGVNLKYSEYQEGMDLKTGEWKDFDAQFQEMSLDDMANPDKNNGYSDAEASMYGRAGGGWDSDRWSSTPVFEAPNESVFVEESEKERASTPTLERTNTQFAPPKQPEQHFTTSRDDRLAQLLDNDVFSRALAGAQKADKEKADSLGFDI